MRSPSYRMEAHDNNSRRVQTLPRISCSYSHRRVKKKYINFSTIRVFVFFRFISDIFLTTTNIYFLRSLAMCDPDAESESWQFDDKQQPETLEKRSLKEDTSSLRLSCRVFITKVLCKYAPIPVLRFFSVSCFPRSFKKNLYILSAESLNGFLDTCIRAFSFRKRLRNFISFFRFPGATWSRRRTCLYTTPRLYSLGTAEESDVGPGRGPDASKEERSVVVEWRTHVRCQIRRLQNVVRQSIPVLPAHPLSQ